MLRAVLLGTGSPPPNPLRRGPATLLALDAERFLVDAGSGVGAQLVRAGIRPYDWPRVLITHHHSDHTIDLGHLLITRWIVGQNAPLAVSRPFWSSTIRSSRPSATAWTPTARASRSPATPGQARTSCAGAAASTCSST